MSVRLNPTRIETARQRRGLSKTEFAKALGLTPRTITKYETEGAPPKALEQIAQVLAFPEPYFHLPDIAEFNDDLVCFRAGKTVAAKTKKSALAAGKHALEISQWIRQRYQLPGNCIPNMTGEDPAVAAQVLRQEWGLGKQPMPNLVQLCESKGIGVFGLPRYADVVDAYSAWHETAPYIFCARRRSPEDVRFDIAHQLGHLLLHAHYPGALTAQEEREANAFATELLVPVIALIEDVNRHHSVNTYQVIVLSRYFDAPAKTTAVQLKKVGKLTEWAYRVALTELAEYRFEISSPNLRPHYERSEVFDFVLSDDEAEKVTARSIANELALPESDVRSALLDQQLGVAAETTPTGGSPEVASHPATTRPQLQLITSE